MKKLLRFAGAAAFCLLVFPFLTTQMGRAQGTLGSLNGTVTDISGAAVPGATVTAVSDQTGLTRSTTSQKNGYWEILNLPVGTYHLTVTQQNFEKLDFPGIAVREMQATTIPNESLKPGQVSESVTVSANPLLNATDTTNGYTVDKAQIATTPLATGSFTQLAVFAPGVSSELLSGVDTNAGLGNQNVWANGQRATSNTWQVNGTDVTNIFNGMSSSGLTSQRYNFNIGGGSTSSSSSAGAPDIGGAAQTATSVYGSTGNSLPSPPPEFLAEMRVNTSMYDAQQGETAGAQVDVNTATGTNLFHGQLYGTFANNSMNGAPFFFKQEYLLSLEGVGAFPQSLANPALHRWTVGGTLGGPIIKDKLFFYGAYQRLYDSDQSTGLTQMTVPSGLTDDRSPTGLAAAAASWNNGKAFTGTIDPIAQAIMQAKLPDGSYMIPSAQTSAPFQYGVPNVTLIGTSLMTSDQGYGSLQYNVSNTDQLTAKYYYQSDPVDHTYGMSQTGGFPQTQSNGSQVAAIGNTNSVGSRMNFSENLGYVRMFSYSYYTQTVPGGNFGIGGTNPGGFYQSPGMPGLLIDEMAANNTVAPGLKVGPYSSFADIGFYQNRLNPSADVIFTTGKHTVTAGGGYSYTQLNIENNRDGVAQIASRTFESFLEGSVHSSSVVESIANGRNNADRYYRTNEGASYLQDKWQALSNLSVTAGVRYDYHGGLTEKYGNMFNFDPTAYNVTGTTTSGFTVNNAGFVIAGNNKFNPTHGVSDSTLTGRQWGISPRIGFAWSPKRFHDSLVWRGGFGLYYDRGELFSYLSQPAGSGNGGPFGVTESAPLTSYVTGTGSSLSNYLGTPVYTPAGSNPAIITQALQAVLNQMTGSPAAGSTYAPYGPNCGGVQSQEGYFLCPATLNFAAYDKSNVLPYTMNFTLNAQWQPTANVAITIGYTGNRGRHAVIPIPFNEPGIATATNPIHGETDSYGFEVLNQNNTPDGYDYAPIAGEPWNTADGGNTDFRTPYVGFSPNAAFFETNGNSAYDALETHIEKKLSHHLMGGMSYTFSHTYDEQSDIGIFFTGNNPTNLRDSYAHSDFDRTNVFNGFFDVAAPNVAKDHTLLAWATNDWHVGGWGVAQSGQPYSLYEFYGAVGSINFGDFPTLMNPVLGIKNPSNPKSAMTGNSGKFRSGANYIPAIDPSQLAINYIQPGQMGVPVSTGSDPQDIYETNFATGDQRNIFRQASQRQLNLTIRKQFHPSERFTLEYHFNIFNLTNTTSLDVPQNQTQVRQNYGCSASAFASYGGNNNCADAYVNYGQVATSNSATDQQSALTDLDQLPYHNGSGKTTTIPLTLPAGTLSCTTATISGGCPNNGANFGSVTDAIGSARVITMGLHVLF